MDAWIDWAKGPMFRFALAVLVFGLMRHLFIVTAGVLHAMHRAGDKKLPWGAVVKATFSWLIPVKRMGRHPIFTVASVLFHVGAIVSPLFLVSHVALIEGSIGLSWPTLPATAADTLTWLAIIGLTIMLVIRLTNPTARATTQRGDLAWLVLLLVTFLAGYLTMHPTQNPVPARTTLLIHLMAANLAMILMPFTKLVHAVTLPLTQLVSEVAWHFPPDAGDKVARTLGKENQPI